ncbi:MAG TPA: hypothetical protein VGY54_14940 [Polyangiaceae bacterium]|jgi:hypothetical protein|nr:hypothetical protein [Polyangiaceae bacterium]
MSSKQKLPPHEAWDALEKMALHDEAERVASLSEAELDRELQEKGFDPKAVRERGAALAEKLRAASAAPPVPQAPMRRTLPARARWAALAAAAMAAVGTAVAIPTAVTVVGKSAAQHASELRRDALGACQKARWLECQQGLDAARNLDPASEDLPEVKAAREKIAAELRLPKETR